MVAHRSPKPLVWVRILVPLPKFKRAIQKGKIMYSLFSRFFIFFIIFITFVAVCFTPFVSSDDINSNILVSTNGELIWPLPNHFTITSYFGRRKSPTGGASSYHSGLDIGAPEGTPFVSAFPGKVIFIGFSGAGRIHYYNSKSTIYSLILPCIS